MFNRNIIEESFAEPKRKRGAPIPLFEKLIDEDKNNSDEIPPLRFYNQFELMQSIQWELGRILNTRANAVKAEYDQLSIDNWNFALPQMYGLADFSQYDATNEGHHPHIAVLCENAIRLFEPRLKNPRVTILEFNNKKFCLLINITATLNIKDFQDEVTFPLEIQA